jgi:hypothetical protein
MYESYDPQSGWYTPDHSAEPIFVGSTGTAIDWQVVIQHVENQQGTVLPKLIWPNPHFAKMKALYEDSNYLLESAEWINYYPGEHYDEKLNEAFGEIVGKPRYARAWISRINPGKTAPWHWDLDDGEPEYLKNGTLVRYVCKMNVSGTAQVTIMGDHALHNWRMGDIYQWPDHRMWHGSVNAGLLPKYQFNYLAYV